MRTLHTKPTQPTTRTKPIARTTNSDPSKQSSLYLRVKQDAILLVCPRSFRQFRVKVIEPPLAALFAHPPGNGRRNFAPLYNHLGRGVFVFCSSTCKIPGAESCRASIRKIVSRRRAWVYRSKYSFRVVHPKVSHGSPKSCEYQVWLCSKRERESCPQYLKSEVVIVVYGAMSMLGETSKLARKIDLELVLLRVPFICKGIVH